MIWAVVLAAGESKRMGKAKLLLSFGQKSIIETILENVVHSAVDNTLIVLGADWQKVQEKVKSYSVETTINPYFRKGMLSSVQWGFKKLPEKARAALVILGDQPQISADVINLVLEAYKGGKRGIVLPVYKDSGGHPLLVDMKYREEIQTLSPDKGLRHLLSLHPDDIQKVEVKESCILQDMDDIEDYRRLLKRQ